MAGLKATLTVLVDEAEKVVRGVCSLVKKRAGLSTWPRNRLERHQCHGVRTDWKGVANLHQLTTSAEVVYGLQGTFSNQVARLREAVRVLHITQKEVNPHGYAVHVRGLEKQLKALIRD